MDCEHYYNNAGSAGYNMEYYRRKMQEQKIASLETFQRNSEQFIEDTARIDSDVADVINQRKDDFVAGTLVLTSLGLVAIKTYDHTFYVNDYGFVSAGELYIGDRLFDPDGNVLIIEDRNVETLDEAVNVYNFQVRNFHTYHVGENCVLVYNADYPENPDDLLNQGYQKITPEGMKNNTLSRGFYNPETGDAVRFDPAKPGASGFEGKDHYHQKDHIYCHKEIKVMIKYNLHDSLIEKVNYLNNKKRLEISIELCNWQQPGYKDSDPEMIEILMVFEEVEKFELSIDCYEFDSNEILDVVCVDDRTTKVVFLTENGAEILTVTADKLSFLTI